MRYRLHLLAVETAAAIGFCGVFLLAAKCLPKEAR